MVALRVCTEILILIGQVLLLHGHWCYAKEIAPCIYP